MEEGMNWRLIIVPCVITLGVTLLRLIGELRHWPARWFSTETGGIVPSGVSWVFGITWLAAIFGAYFALKLISTGRKPESLSKAIVFAIIGILIFVANESGVKFLSALLHLGFPHYLICVWFFFVLAGALQYFGWPELFKMLLLYAYAARIPVAIVMFFAMLGHWGTHYDYVGIQFPLYGLPKYLWLAFFPQLVAWIGFTITLGSVAGIIAAFGARLFSPQPGTDNANNRYQ
jgi:hypothetical protein